MFPAKSKPITVDIIYRPPNEVDFIDYFNNAVDKLPFQSTEIYLLGYFNIHLFLEGHYVLKKKKFKSLVEAHLKYRLLNPYIKTILAFGLNQLMENSTRSTLSTVFVIDRILANPKEKVINYGAVSCGMSDHHIIYCAKKTKAVKIGKHTTISIRSYRKYF